MQLYAISDLHLDRPENRAVLRQIEPHPADWLLIAGDVGHAPEHLKLCFDTLVPLFSRVIWTPGNHDLWTVSRAGEPRGVARYEQLVSVARSYGVSTPEDPFPIFMSSDGPLAIAPIFVLYDYSFRPPSIPLEKVLEWAAEADCVCADEHFLSPDPYPTRGDWCAARCAETEKKLINRIDNLPTVLVSHFPLEQALAVLPRVPRFTPWCGTRQTKDWHLRFNARAAVFGHLHIPGTRLLDGVPFQEVSLGYPEQWARRTLSGGYLREVKLAPLRSTNAA